MTPSPGPKVKFARHNIMIDNKKRLSYENHQHTRSAHR